jgi:hypothetical protein
VYVTYFDEVKAIPGQNTYFVGGIVVPMDQIGGVEAKLNALSAELFDSIDLVPETEFHASFIYRGKGPFKGWTMEKRVETIARLADILTEGNFIRRVFAAIDTTKLKAPQKAAEFAFAHFCERVQMCVGEQTSIMIGDLDDEQARNMVRDFSRYRAKGTPWAYGIEIKTIVDSIHFCRSHHSRLIQLADVYLYLVTHKWGSRGGDMAKMLCEAVKDKNLFPTNYKVWPN